MIRQAARVAVVTHTIAAMAFSRVPSFALVFVMAIWFTGFLALGILPLGGGGTT